MDEEKTSDHIQINIKMRNPSQEPPASSKYLFTKQPVSPTSRGQKRSIEAKFKFWVISQPNDFLYYLFSLKVPEIK